MVAVKPALRQYLRGINREQKEKIAAAVYTLRLKRSDPLFQHREKYYLKPLDWITDNVELTLPRYMQKIFGEIQDGASRVALQGPHGIGKTVFASLLLLWAGTVSEDCKIPTTASSWRQLTKFLWPEIHKWFGRVRWDKVGKAPDLITLECQFGTNSTAFAVACQQASTIEGAHASRVVYIYDEAKTIPEATFQASEGAFSTHGPHLAVVLSTPGDASGEFYNICSKKQGYHAWKVFYISPRQAIREGRMSLDWARDCRAKWGEKNPAYLNRVWGLFAEDNKDATIPLRWVMAAVERWYAWTEAGGIRSGKKRIGADVSRGGNDREAMAIRYGKILTEMKYQPGKATADTMETAGRIKNEMGADGEARVDVIGIGAGVVDRLREQVGDRCVPINAAEGTDLTDRSGELRFVNIRSAMWWNMRDLLDPNNKEDVALPDDPELIGDLTTPTYKITSNGKILIEAKDSIKKRIGRSTDAGDAVCHAFFDAMDAPDYVTVG